MSQDLDVCKCPTQAKGNAEELQEKSKEHKKKIQEAEEKEKEATAARDKKISHIGNLVHDSVPVSNDEVGCRDVQAWTCVTAAHICACATVRDKKVHL